MFVYKLSAIVGSMLMLFLVEFEVSQDFCGESFSAVCLRDGIAMALVVDDSLGSNACGHHR